MSDEYRRELFDRLDALRSTLIWVRALAEQGRAADRAELETALDDLTRGICEEGWWRVCVKVPDGTRAGEKAYFAADNVYQEIQIAVTGHMDDGLNGYLDFDAAAAKWSDIAATLLAPEKPVLLAPAELDRICAAARDELARAEPKPWPLPAVYAPPGALADRWSAEAAERNRGRLPLYREGEPFDRQPRPENPQVSDVMLVAPGEPADRFVTKLGGLPYRPASIPWPRTATGEPRVFFGQVCFADSLDLVGELPGDVLLIFTHDPQDHATGGDLRYEWYPLGIEGLATAADVPETPWAVFPCYMHLSRHEEPVGADERPEWVQWAKIGGDPHWIQHGPRDPGRFLAAFESVDWVDRPPDTDPRLRHLDFFDCGLLNLFLLPDGHVGEHFQCY